MIRKITRMDLQKKYDVYNKIYGHNKAVRELEKEFGVKKIVVNKSGQVAYFESMAKAECLLKLKESRISEEGFLTITKETYDKVKKQIISDIDARIKRAMNKKFNLRDWTKEPDDDLTQVIVKYLGAK